MSAESTGAQSGAPKSNGKMTVRYGIHTVEVPAGSTLGEVRKQLTPTMRIPAEAVGYSGNSRIDDSTVLTEGQHVEFVKKTGEKG